MLYFFLDDGGTDARSPVITMAGYVALGHHWAIFDKRAKKLYARYVTQLHASDFHGTKGEFAGWSGDKKMEFVRELFTLVRKGCVLGVSVSVVKDTKRHKSG
jgi:type II secretory pathway component PulF